MNGVTLNYVQQMFTLLSIHNQCAEGVTLLVAFVPGLGLASPELLEQ